MLESLFLQGRWDLRERRYSRDMRALHLGRRTDAIRGMASRVCVLAVIVVSDGEAWMLVGGSLARDG